MFWLKIGCSHLPLRDKLDCCIFSGHLDNTARDRTDKNSNRNKKDSSHRRSNNNSCDAKGTDGPSTAASVAAGVELSIT